MSYKYIIVVIIQFISLSAIADTSETLLNQIASWPTDKLIETADLYREQGEDQTALIYYLMAVSKPQESNKDRSQERLTTKAYLSIGDIHYSLGNYSNALRAYVSGLKLSDSLPDKPYIALFYKNMGNIYNVFQNYEMGLHLYQTGLKEAKNYSDSETEYKLLQNLTAVSIRLNNIDEARRYYRETKDIKVNKTPNGLFMEEFNLALILYSEHKYDRSIDILKKLIGMANEVGLSKKYICDAYDEIARIELERGNKEQALEYLKKCTEDADKAGILHLYVTALKNLYTLYDDYGEHVLARGILDKYVHIKDSVYNQQQIDAAKNQQVLYEMEKTEKTIAELNKTQIRQSSVLRRQRLIIILGFGGIMLISIVLYVFYRQKRKVTEAYRSLFALNREMMASQKEAKEGQSRLKEICERQEHIIRELESKLEITSGNEPRYSRSNLTDDNRERLAEAISEIMENGTPYTSPDFSLSVIAEMTESNSKYVSQVINEVFAKNFSSYVNDYRIRLACERLADRKNYANYSIRGIGESVGFKSPTSFVQAFKKATGMSPSVYQKLSFEECTSKKISME